MSLKVSTLFASPYRFNRRIVVLSASLVAFSLGIYLVLNLRAATGSFEVVGIHPQAVQQSTLTGKSLHTLEAWQGKIYAGYGDYSSNTGPISISPFDPATNTFTQVHTSDTEAIYNFRVIRDNLYAPATDRIHNADYAVGAPWRDVGPMGSTHAFDMVTLDGSDLWLVGSKSIQAVAWRSLDNGATWTRSLAIGPESGIQGDFARFYAAGAYNNKLYVHAVDYSGGRHNEAWVFDGVSWSKEPSLYFAVSGSKARPVVFNGKLIFLDTRLATFDGSQTQHNLSWYPVDFKVADDGYLYLLIWGPTEYAVLRTQDLNSWQRLNVAPPFEYSLAVLNGEIYIGGRGAKLYKLVGDHSWQNEPAPIWSNLPQVEITQPADKSTFTAPASINLAANASDEEGVSKVTFYRGGARLAEDTTAPYSYNWTNVQPGTYKISANATDTHGSVVSKNITVTVTDPTPDSIDPAVSITSPAVGSTVSGTTNVNASASDNVGVTKVEFLVDGAVKSSDASSPYSFSWDTSGYTNGPHTLIAKAYDAAGNVGTSVPVVVTVDNQTPPPDQEGDLNNDGKVNIFDLSILLSNWGQEGPLGDINGDGQINIFDLSILLSKWSP